MSDPLKTLDGREGGLVLSKDYSADMNQAYRDAKVDMQSLRAENARLREQAEALATALADARRWMMATNDYESLSPAGHSLTRDAISTADAALRAYRGQP